MAKRKTIQEKVIEYLDIKGFKEIESKSNKYRTFIDPKKELEACPTKFFVGKRGALRAGLTSSKSRSVFGTITHKLIDRLIKEASA